MPCWHTTAGALSVIVSGVQARRICPGFLLPRDHAVTPVLLALMLSAPTLARKGPPPSIQGPRHTHVPLYKPWPGADKVYVQADLGDGVPRLMLLDTGAAVTFVTPKVAQELALAQSDQVDRYMQISGLLEARSAVLPSLRLGRETLHQVRVAVPTGDVLDRVGGVEVAGYLGNNVLSHFQLVVDYPANRLELSRAGTRPVPEGAAPLYYDGQHAMTGVVLVATKDGQTVEQQLLVDIDTGARGLFLFGSISHDLAALATRGLEPMVGVSRDDDLPLRSWLRETRRIPITQVHAGGAVVKRDLDATWTAEEETLGGEGEGEGGGGGGVSSPGLLGFAVMDGFRAVLDYPAQRFALLPPDKERPENDMQGWRLSQLRHSDDPLRRVRMAELYLWMGDPDHARTNLERHHRKQPEEPEGTILLARMRRLDGDIRDAANLLAGVSASDLVDKGEIIARVNGLWLDGQTDQALAVAQEAVDEVPKAPPAWVALADARHAAGDLTGAREALLQANLLAENPDGNLLRRAWVATDEGDLYAALTHLRRQLELDPSGQVTPWFYGIVAQAAGQVSLLRV